MTSAPSPDRAPGTRARLVALDVVRTAAILGMMAVHIGGPNIHYPTGPWQVLDLASGFAAGTFAVVAGVALSLTNPTPTSAVTNSAVTNRRTAWVPASGWLGLARASASERADRREQEPAPSATGTTHRGRSGPRAWLPTMVRGVALFVLGLLVEPLSGGVLVILCVYGALFVIAAPLRDLSARALATLGLVLLIAWPVASLAIRRTVTSSSNLEISWALFGQPGWPTTVARTLFLDGTYPVPTWMALVLLAWAAHRSGLLAPQHRRLQAAVSAGLIVVAFGGAALVEAIWHPREQVVAELVANGWSTTRAEIDADHALGVPNAEIWPSLLTAGHHTGTWFELLQILAVAMTLYTLAGLLWVASPATAAVLSLPGRVALSIYVGHLAVLSATGWFWLGASGLGASADSVPTTAMPAFWATMAFWALAFGFGWLFRRSRGPIEALLRWLARATAPRRQDPLRSGESTHHVGEEP